MNLSELLLVVQWWGVFLLLSAAVLPLTITIFMPFSDRGYIFSKTLALAFISYIALLFGTMKVLPFSQISLMALILSLGVISYGMFFRSIKHPVKHIRDFVRDFGKMIILQEILFFLMILFWTWVRAYSPDIHGLEKYMDFGFMNSIARGEYFPPKDMWLTPFTINYYYFGHFTGAVLTKLSGIPSYLTYNLILASVFALSFVGSFSLGLNLYRRILPDGAIKTIKPFIAGLLTAVLVTLSGNLHTLYTLFLPYKNESPVPLWQLAFRPDSFPNAYWYPNATRFIFNTIHEFPMYSWVVADLHGHVFDIPFVITTLAVLFSLLIQSQTTSNTSPAQIKKLKADTRQFPFKKIFITWRFAAWYIPLLSFLLAVQYMTNAWDGLIYMLLTGLFLLYIHLNRLPQGVSLRKMVTQGSFLIPLIVSGGMLLLGFVLFSLPFSLHFKPFVSGIGVLCAPQFLVNLGSVGPFLFEADHCQRSPWWQLMILYGFFYFFIFSFLAFLTRVRTIRIADTYVLLIIILGTLLIMIPEFLYVKDIYPAHYRANTMFKLVFQSFILLSIASSYSLVRIIHTMRGTKLKVGERIASVIFLIIAGAFLILVLIYPFQAVDSYYGGLKTYKGINGTTYLQDLYPTDYAGITWLNDHVTGQPVLLEAQGDSYTDFARVSANTGLPTVLGWTVHEWLWRNGYDIPKQPPDPQEIYEVPAPRIAEVQTLYETADVTETARLLKKYKVEYVFLGVLERQKYPNLNEEKWNELGEIVFENGITKIYRIR